MKRWQFINFFFVFILISLISIDVIGQDQFTFVECDNGAVRNCPNQVGVCSGFQETCTNSVWPGCDFTSISGYEASEVSCDGLDNDCDGQVDEPFPELGTSCTVGTGSCSATGTYICKADKTGTECNAVEGSPTTEICDGLDNDCDGNVDEDLTASLADKQNGVCSGSVKDCNGVNGWQEPDYSLISGYEATEVSCDGLDNDCDNIIDEDCCFLDFVTLTHNCGANNLCEPGENIEIEAGISGNDCSIVGYIQVDAEDTNCRIEHLNGDLVGIGSSVSVASGDPLISTSWLIPSFGATNDCIGQTVHGVGAAIWSDGSPGTGTYIDGVNANDINGLFTFIGAGGSCRDNVCEGNIGEDCSTCSDDCGVCPADCGDNLCDPSETCSTCETDCGVCNGDDTCGDNVCEGNIGEDCSTCSDDCGVCPADCGDNLCDPSETCSTCETDCGVCIDYCGNGDPELGEDCYTCPDDDGCVGDEICYIDIVAGTGECREYDPNDPPGICNDDGICDAEESCDCVDCENEQDGCILGRMCNEVVDSFICACDNQDDGVCPLGCTNDPDCAGDFCGNGVLDGLESCEFYEDTGWSGCGVRQICTGKEGTGIFDSLTAVGFDIDACDCITYQNGWILFLSRGECVAPAGELEGEQEVIIKAKCIFTEGCSGDVTIGDYQIPAGSYDKNEEVELATTTEACTLPPEKIPFFTNLNILLVIGILIGYYLYKKKD